MKKNAKPELFTEEQCAVRVVQVRRAPTKTPKGIYRRPCVIDEVVSLYYHRCEWCQLWFKPTNNKQRFCSFACRHSSFRERQRREIDELRRGARK